MFKHKKTLGILITVFSLFAIGIYLYVNRTIFLELKNIRLLPLVFITLLHIISLYNNGIALKLLALPFKIKLKNYFLLSIASTFFNLITPFKGGAGIRAIYMKKRYQLKYSEFAAALFGNYVIISLVTALLGLIIIVFIYFQEAIFSPAVTLVFLVIPAVSILIIKTKIPFKNEKIREITGGWQIIKTDKILIIKLAALTCISILIIGLQNWITFRALGIEISLIQSFYVAIVGTLGIFINITPGSLGITEALYLFSAKIINIDPAYALLAALIIRASSLILMLIAGPIANYFLVKNFQNSQDAAPKIPQG